MRALPVDAAALKRKEKKIISPKQMLALRPSVTRSLAALAGQSRAMAHL